MANTPVVTHRLKNLAGFTGLSCVVIGIYHFALGVMLASAVGRVTSLVSHGRPRWFQDVLTAVEFIVPAAFFGLATADEKGL